MRYLLLRLKRFCGFITGFVFLVGGILKLMDPVGTGMIMSEYLDFLHLRFLGPASKSLGMTFALAETVIGTALITGVWRKIFGIAALVFQGFFTLLTLALVIFNPEMDCGCFGEAIHLTHMQTFLKNIVLSALLCAYFFPSKWLGTPKSRKYVSFGIGVTSCVAFMIYSLMYIPLVDFTDYKPSSVLKAGSAFAASSEDKYEAVFIYEKDGNEETFDLTHLPDSSWTFVRTETRIREGYEETGLIDLSFYDDAGEYMDSLATQGRVMVVSVYDTDISKRRWQKIRRFMSNAEKSGFTPLLLVSGIPSGDDEEFPAYTSDYKTLASMNRSNGGVTYFSDGYLIRKWAFRAMPTLEELMKIHEEDTTQTVTEHDTKGSLAFQGFLLYIFSVMLLL